MAVLWSTVLIYLIAIIIVLFIVCKTRIKLRKVRNERISAMSGLSGDLIPPTNHSREHESKGTFFLDNEEHTSTRSQESHLTKGNSLR